MKLVMVGVVFVQFVTLFYSIVREGNVSGRSIVLIILLILTCLVLFGLIVLGWFSYLLPKIRLRMGKEYSIFGYGGEEEERIVEPGEYIAPVLLATGDTIPQDTLENDMTSGGGGGGKGISQSYESFGRTIAGGQVKLSPSRETAKKTAKKERKPSLVTEEDEDKTTEEETQ